MAEDPEEPWVGRQSGQEVEEIVREMEKLYKKFTKQLSLTIGVLGNT